ncbi:hypothetical protein Tcan_00602, partial [Toxocara canis]
MLLEKQVRKSQLRTGIGHGSRTGIGSRLRAPSVLQGFPSLYHIYCEVTCTNCSNTCGSFVNIDDRKSAFSEFKQRKFVDAPSTFTYYYATQAVQNLLTFPTYYL